MPDAEMQPVIALYQRWVKAGPPPLGVSLARWWDRRLVELRDAIGHRNDANNGEQPARTTADNSPTSSDVSDNSLRDQLQAAIESEVYEFRERTMWWPEGEITKEIARLATRGATETRDRELEQLRAKVAEFDHIINWHTTCASCARILDSAYQETMRAEKAEVALREVLGAFEAYWARASYCGPSESAVQPEHFKAWRSVLQPADHDAGLTVAECRQDDRVWPHQREGE
jgi:hypothetical protein